MEKATHIVIDFTDVIIDSIFQNGYTLNSYVHKYIGTTLSSFNLNILNDLEYLFPIDVNSPVKEEGFSGIFLLSTSHCSYHYWPEKKFMSFDLYTCLDLKEDRIKEITEQIEKLFYRSTMDVKILKRYS